MMSLRIQEAFGQSVASLEDLTLDFEWDDPETRNEQSFLETMKSKLELGIPKQQIWREMGYSQEEIDQMDADARQTRVADTNIGAEILRSFQGGAMTGDEIVEQETA